MANRSTSYLHLFLLSYVLCILFLAFFYQTDDTTSTARIIAVFYFHSQATQKFFHTNGSISRSNYFRILALGCLEIIITLPFSIISLVLNIELLTHSPYSASARFYQGWHNLHSHWTPKTSTLAERRAEGFWPLFAYYFPPWSSITLGLAMVILIGFTRESRTKLNNFVKRPINAVRRHLKPQQEIKPQQSLETLEFRDRIVDDTIYRYD
jgi:hypothetical protein